MRGGGADPIVVGMFVLIVILLRVLVDLNTILGHTRACNKIRGELIKYLTRYIDIVVFYEMAQYLKTSQRGVQGRSECVGLS